MSHENESSNNLIFVDRNSMTPELQVTLARPPARLAPTYVQLSNVPTDIPVYLVYIPLTTPELAT